MEVELGDMQVDKQQTIKWKSGLDYDIKVKNGELVDCRGMPSNTWDWENILADIAGFAEFLSAIANSVKNTRGK